MTDAPVPEKKLQLLLDEAWRTPAGVDGACKILDSLGVQPESRGAATISVRVNDDQFAKLFAADGSQGPGLAIPAALSKYVSSISEAPDHLHFKTSKGNDDESL